ncbi:auxin efflux carrier [Dichotomocladium elegans]|nr:auxin efflux carrier [Dichotomocladium elegans]
MSTVSFGYLLARLGYFTHDKQKWLSKLNMVFFTPCLLFSNIASVMSLEKFVAYWPIPVFYICFSTISFLAAHLVCRIARIDRHFRGFVVACVMFMNTNSLPIAVISSLAVSEAGKILYWDADDTQDSVAARGISYVLFYAVFGNILRWSYGYSLLQFRSERDEVVFNSHADDTIHSDTHSRFSSTASLASSTTNTSTSSYKPILPGPGTSIPNERTGLLASFPHLPSDADHSDNHLSTKDHIIRAVHAVHGVMTPPLYAALIALFVGLIPPIKYLAFNSFLYAAFIISIQSCGKAAVPIILVCLGAQLCEISRTSQQTSWRRKPVWAVVGIRLLLTPFLIIPIVIAFVMYGRQWSGIAADPVFNVMMIVIGCAPTAINLVQISQVTGAFENEMLHMLFYSYGIVCVPVFTLVVFAALSIVDRLM